MKVEAPSVDEAILILKGLRAKYEEHHKAEITDPAVEAAVKLSDATSRIVFCGQGD